MGLFSSLFGGKKTEESQQEKQEKKNFDILKYDGIRARNMHQYAYAIKCLEQAIALREDIEAMECLATAYIASNDLDAAAKTYARMTEVEPENVKASLSLANVYFMLEKYEEMNEACNKAIAIDEKNQYAYYLAAKAQRGLRNDLQAIVMLSKAIAADEEYLPAYLLRAETLFDMCQPKEALKDVDVVLSKEEENEDALLLKGEIEAVLDNLEVGFACLDKVIELNPFNDKAYFLKGNILTELKRFDEAISVLDDAVELIPNNAKIYKERGRAKLLKGDKAGSIADVKKSIEINPDSENDISGNFNNFSQPKTGIY